MRYLSYIIHINIICDTCLIFVVALKYIFFVTNIRIYNHKVSNVVQTVLNLLMVTKVFPSESDICARGVLLLVEVECWGLGVNSE